MVCLLMPAALATSDSVIDDQSRVKSMSRMPSRIEWRSRTRDASANGTRCADPPPVGAPLIGSGIGATLSLPVAALAQAIVITRRSARPGKSRPGNLDHLEVRLGRAAVRAAPVFWDVVPTGAGCNAVLGPPLLLVVLESTLHADEQLVCLSTHFIAPISSKSIFSRTEQSGQHQSSGTSSHLVPAGNPSRGAPFASS